ncbi:MAG: RICIN domain-containing protein [Micromonosporaceae bacterium]
MKVRSILVAGLLGLVALVAGSPAYAAPHSPEATTDVIARTEGATTLDAGTAAAGPYYLQFRHSGKCAEVPGASKSSGVALDQWTCVSQANEWWYLDYIFTDGNGYDFFRIRNANSGLCMNVGGGSTANGAHIIQYPCGAYGNEYFVFWADGNVASGYFWVQAYSSGKVLNIAGGSTSNGADLIQYSRCYCNNEYVRLG